MWLVLLSGKLGFVNFVDVGGCYFMWAFTVYEVFVACVLIFPEF